MRCLAHTHQGRLGVHAGASTEAPQPQRRPAAPAGFSAGACGSPHTARAPAHRLSAPAACAALCQARRRRGPPQARLRACQVQALATCLTAAPRATQTTAGRPPWVACAGASEGQNSRAAAPEAVVLANTRVSHNRSVRPVGRRHAPPSSGRQLQLPRRSCCGAGEVDQEQPRHSRAPPLQGRHAAAAAGAVICSGEGGARGDRR